MRIPSTAGTVSVLAGLFLSVTVQAAGTLKIGLIEPLSGPVAAIGRDTLNGFKFVAEKINKRGGIQIEVIGLDNAMNAEKTTQQLKKAADRGLSFVSQGVGSNHALNIIKFVDKHNKRNPDKPLVYFNHSAVTTAFTNELCSFWHFRFDINVDMKVAALTTEMGNDPSVKKVYMLNQNYAYGKSFQSAARRLLKQRAPDALLVGDELIAPFGKVQDFTPFIAKIKASGADTILTGNWGADIVRFVKAAVASGLDTQFYTIYGGLSSSLAGYGDSAKKVRLKHMSDYHENDNLSPELRALTDAFKEKYKQTWYSDRLRWLLEMVAAAAEKAGSTDPIPVAKALEGMSFNTTHGPVTMRANDHQIQAPIIISHVSADVKRPVVYDGKNFGVAFKTDAVVPIKDTELQSTCKMKRPG